MHFRFSLNKLCDYYAQISFSEIDPLNTQFVPKKPVLKQKDSFVYGGLCITLPHKKSTSNTLFPEHTLFEPTTYSLYITFLSGTQTLNL